MILWRAFGAAYLGAAAFSLLATPLAIWALSGTTQFMLVVVPLAGQAGAAVGLALFSKPHLRSKLLIAQDTLFVVLLPLFGMLVELQDRSCAHSCEAQYELLAEPGQWLVYALYGWGALALIISRRRVEPLPMLTEVMLSVAMLSALLVCVLLQLQIGPALVAVVAIPLLPVAAPLLAGVTIALELWARWSHLGRPQVAAAGGGLAALLGVQALVGGVRDGMIRLYLGAFVDTCGWTLSQMVPPEADCHYLCTVAAQGHPWLVGPERIGQRNGQKIVVNRQLAIANAFEDLLHERWPGFGRLARRTYDWLAFDVSKLLLTPLAADALYLLMLPLEGFFWVFLLLFDPANPTQRTQRMYR